MRGYFCLHDTETRGKEFFENTAKKLSGGVGPQVAELLAKQGIDIMCAMEIGSSLNYS